MTNNSPLIPALSNLFATRATQQELLRASTGDGQGNVIDPSRSDYMFVRIRGAQTQIVSALNLQVPMLNNLAVDVIRTTDHNKVIYAVKGLTQGITYPPKVQNIANVVMHALTHLPYGYDPIPFAFTNVHVSGNYNALASDSYIDVSTGVALTITLPDIALLPLGKAYLIHDSTGGAGAHNLTIGTTNGQLIEGNLTYVINVNRGSALLISDGRRWTVPIHL